jgi:hypothetical protein
MIMFGPIPPSWSGHALSADAAAGLIGDTIGISVRVAEPLRNNLVFLEPRGTAARGMIEPLAVALHASVRRTPNGILLERTKEDQDSAERTRTAQRATWLIRELALRKKFRDSHLGSQTRLDQVYFRAVDEQRARLLDIAAGRRSTLDMLTPGTLLPWASVMDGLLSRIGPERFARVPTGEVRIFEDSPVVGAEPLPKHSDLVADYEAAMQTLRQTYMPGGDGRTAISAKSNLEIADWSTSHSVVRVRLAEQAYECGMAFQLEGFDSDGGMVASCSLSANAASMPLNPRQILAGLRDPEKNTIRLSSEAYTALRFAENAAGEAVPSWFQAPTRHEPLDLFVREVLGGVANRDQSGPFVAVVRDDYWRAVCQCAQGGGVNIDAFISYVAQGVPSDMEVVGKATVWRPLDPSFAESIQCDRRALQTFARDCMAVGHADIRTVSQLFRGACRAEGTPAPLASAWLLIEQSAARAEPTLRSSLGNEYFRPLAQVPDEVWERLTSGQTFTVAASGLSGAMDALLAKEIFERAEGGGPVASWDRFLFDLVAQAGPDRMTISLRPLPGPIIKTRTAANSWLAGGQTLAEFVNGFMLTESSFRWDSGTASLATSREQFEKGLTAARYMLCRPEGFDMIVGFPGDMSITVRFRGQLVPLSGELAYSDLPQSIRGQVWNHACAAGLAMSQAVHANAHGSGPNPLMPTTKPPP